MWAEAWANYMMNKKDVWVHCSLTAGELHPARGPLHLPSLTHLNQWLLNWREEIVTQAEIMIESLYLNHTLHQKPRKLFFV